MGNCCSSSSERDAFAQPGRVLGSTPPAPTSVSVPASASASKSPRTVGGPPRTLGGGGSAGESSSAADDARAKAAAAAEARFQQSKKGGKLQAALDQQRGMTDAEALKKASETERRQRDLDQNTDALNYS